MCNRCNRSRDPIGQYKNKYSGGFYLEVITVKRQKDWYVKSIIEFSDERVYRFNNKQHCPLDFVQRSGSNCSWSDLDCRQTKIKYGWILNRIKRTASKRGFLTLSRYVYKEMKSVSFTFLVEDCFWL